MGTQRQRAAGPYQWGLCAHRTGPGKRSDGGRGNRTAATGTPGSLGVVTVSRVNAARGRPLRVCRPELRFIVKYFKINNTKSG